MPAAKKTTPVAVAPTFCIVIITMSEGRRINVEFYGTDVEGAKGYCSARSEDGDGTYQFFIRRVTGQRAIDMTHEARCMDFYSQDEAQREDFQAAGRRFIAAYDRKEVA